MCVAGFPRRIYPAVNFPSRASYMGCGRDASPLVGDYSRGRFAHFNLGSHLLNRMCGLGFALPVSRSVFVAGQPLISTQ